MLNHIARFVTIKFDNFNIKIFVAVVMNIQEACMLDIPNITSCFSSSPGRINRLWGQGRDMITWGTLVHTKMFGCLAESFVKIRLKTSLKTLITPYDGNFLSKLSATDRATYINSQHFQNNPKNSKFSFVSRFLNVIEYLFPFFCFLFISHGAPLTHLIFRLLRKTNECTQTFIILYETYFFTFFVPKVTSQFFKTSSPSSVARTCNRFSPFEKRSMFIFV